MAKFFSHGKDHVLNINLCVKLVMPFIFTLFQKWKLGCSTKAVQASCTE